MQKLQTCVILAGGKSSRMGRDKTLLPFGNAPTLTHFLAGKMGQIFTDVYVSAKAQKFTPPLALIADENDAGFSPMIALAKILNQVDHSVFIIPADMPFVTIGCIQELAKFRDKFDVVVAKDSEHRHSLCGFFSPKMAAVASELAFQNEHKIGLLLSKFSCKEVFFENSSQFANINNPDEYERALRCEF